MNTTADIECRAAEWLAREDEALGERDREALEAWLAESTAHRVAYLRLKASWKRADRLAALRGPTPDEHASVLSTPRPEEVQPWARGRRWLAAAVVAALGVALWLAFAPSPIPMTEHQTLVGGREVVPLADGSRLELNTATRLRVRLTDATRTVWLDQGEAYFDVAHDEGRPFVVIAGARRVTVVGTKFSVRREGDDLQVRVVEGKVRVESPPAGPAPVTSSTSPAVVVRSQVAIAKLDSTLVAQRSPQEITDELAWRQGMLVMNQWTLADAAREFNRYNQKKLVVAPAVADIRLGGTFESANVEVFSRLLKDGFGLHVEVGGDRIVVSN
jgi:transmembrane sensor